MLPTNDFAMFTDQGDLVAEKIVELRFAAGLTWAQTLKVMELMAKMKSEEYGEILDTAVREEIYDRCEFTTDFYV
jgi:hypothetical protein